MALSKEYVVTSLQSLYGENVTSGDLRAWCSMNDCNYQTVTKKLDDYKTGRGKWNLTVQEKLEQTYQATPAIPAVDQDLIPAKDDTFVKLVVYNFFKFITSIFKIFKLIKTCS